MTALLLLAACSGGAVPLLAEEELTLSAASGPEEALVAGAEAVHGAMPADERPDPLRECDAGGAFVDLLGRYDRDGNGILDVPEAEEVEAAREGRTEEERRRVEGAWALLLAVYDGDATCAIDDAERATLLDDFTARCESLQAMLLAEFDADGDGALDDAEEAAARVALAARAPTPPEEGEPHGERPVGGPCDPAPPTPPPLSDYDTDASGTLSSAELEAMRPAFRERIRAGEPVFGPPPR